MLLRYGVSNHYSFRDRQDFSLVASSLDDSGAALFDCPAIKQKVLPAAVIYGANASGKSNFIVGFRGMCRAVMFSHPKWEPGNTNRKSYKLDPEVSEQPTFHDVDFIVDGLRYNYGFECTNQAFTEEWLYAFPTGKKKVVFERSGKDIKLSKDIRKHGGSVNFRVDSLFLSAAIQDGIEELAKIGGFFKRVHEEDEETITDLLEYKEKTIDFLNKINTGVVDLQRKDVQIPDDVKLFHKRIREAIQDIGLSRIPFPEDAEDGKMIKVLLGHSGKDGTTIFFQEGDESLGTIKLLHLLGILFRTLDEGSIMLIDELDDSLHTKACEALIALFCSKETNPNGAQLIVTTHDTNLLRSPFLRRDQFWFVEKARDGASSLYPLTDIKSTRKDENREKGYLEGRYGATPLVGNMDDFIADLSRR